MVGVIDQLRQNDPARTRFYILLSLETSDADLAQALEQNPFVTDISLNLAEEQRQDWNSLQHWIATRANLETVKVEDAHRDLRRIAPAALVRSILQAIQENTAIRSVDLQWIRLPTEITTFVNTASSITSFSINGCYMDPAERQQGARSLAVALQRNTNVETLKLSRLEDIYGDPILEGLRLNTAVKSFSFSPNHSPRATSLAIQQLLRSTTSIQKFELDRASLIEMQFHSIAEAITSSECVSELKFLQCGFQDQNSVAQLQSILQNKRNLSALCLDDCHFADFGTEHLHGDIFSTFLRPDSSLRCFEFYLSGDLEQTITVIQFKNLLQAIAESKLERFQIGRIETRLGTPHHLQALTQSIPSMKLKELEVKFWSDEDSDAIPFQEPASSH